MRLSVAKLKRVPYSFLMAKRVLIGGQRLANVITIWLRRLPDWMWGKDPSYEKLRAEKRHDPAAEPDPRRATAELIATELERLEWQVSYEESESIFSDQPPRSPPSTLR